MLSLRLVARAQKAQILGGHYQRITTASNLLSSSDQPSDSDDTPKQSVENKQVDNNDQSQEIIDPEKFANNVLQAKPPKRDFQVGMTARFTNKMKNKDQTFKEQLSAAAQNVGQRFGKKGPSIAEELRKNYIMSQKKREDVQADSQPTKPDLKGKEKQPSIAMQLLQEEKKSQTAAQRQKALKREEPPMPERKVQEHQGKPMKQSHVWKLLKESKSSQEGRTYEGHKQIQIEFRSLYNTDVQMPSLLRSTDAEPVKTPELKTWDVLERNALETEIKLSPSNIYDEMIQWTLEGKLWRFPIDNEQGLEEEQNIHFSKHVFLETHLTDWCPPKGPVRHFMELVCVGLSKNPYLTVDEKVEHIMWYKNYFAEKQSLLDDAELEALNPAVTAPKEITQ